MDRDRSAFWKFLRAIFAPFLRARKPKGASPANVTPLRQPLTPKFGSPSGVKSHAEAAWRDIHAIEESPQAMSVVRLYAWLIAPEEDIAAAAAALIQRIVDRSSASELVIVDREMRIQLAPRLAAIPASDVGRIARGHAGVLGVMSFDASGRVREAAVRELGRVGDGRAIPFLLIRVNDWVKNVRAAAREALRRFLDDAYTADFARALPIVMGLHDQRRGDHAALIATIYGLFRGPAGSAALREALLGRDARARRLALRFLSADDGPGANELLKLCLAGRDSILASTAASSLRNRSNVSDLEDILRALLGSRFSRVRCEGLTGLAERFPEAASESLARALFDEHAGVREVARFYLRRRGTDEFASLYRGRLNDATNATADPSAAAAIAGLGETGSRADADLAAFFLDHASLRVRAAAVRAVGRLSGDDYDDALIAALGDPQGSVARAAVAALLPRAGRLSLLSVVRLLDSLPTPPARRRVLSVIARLRRWDAIPHLLAATSDPDLRTHAEVHIGRWIAKGLRDYTRPDPDAVTAFAAALEENRKHIAPALLAKLNQELHAAKS